MEKSYKPVTPEIVAEIDRLRGEGQARPGYPRDERSRTEALLADLVTRESGVRLRRLLDLDAEARTIVDAVAARRLDPFAAAEALLEHLLK